MSTSLPKIREQADLERRVKALDGKEMSAQGKGKKRTQHFSKMEFDSPIQQARMEFLTEPDMGAVDPTLSLEAQTARNAHASFLAGRPDLSHLWANLRDDEYKAIIQAVEKVAVEKYSLGEGLGLLNREMAEHLETRQQLTAAKEKAHADHMEFMEEINETRAALDAKEAELTAAEEEIKELREIQCVANIQVLDPESITSICKAKDADLAAAKEELSYAEEDKARLERRRGGECCKCGSWVCPPLTCMACLTHHMAEHRRTKYTGEKL